MWSALVWLTSVAGATEGLAWRWDDAPRRFLLRADVGLAESITVDAEVNRDARMVGFRFDVVTTCTLQQAIGRNVQLACALDDLAVGLAPPVGNVGTLATFAEELDVTYTGASMLVTMSPDGRIRQTELVGPDPFQRRINQIHEPLRIWLTRAFAALEVRLPPKGTDKGKGEWRGTGHLAMGFPHPLGTIGRADVRTTLTEDGPEGRSYTVSGRGVLGPGEMVMVNGTERPKDLFDLTMEGSGLFDVTSGGLVRQDLTVRGVPSASSSVGQVTSVNYTEALTARRLDGDTRVELPVSGEIAP
jgi:hypothetical protein